MGAQGRGSAPCLANEAATCFESRPFSSPRAPRTAMGHTCGDWAERGGDRSTTDAERRQARRSEAAPWGPSEATSDLRARVRVPAIDGIAITAPSRATVAPARSLASTLGMPDRSKDPGVCLDTLRKDGERLQEQISMPTLAQSPPLQQATQDPRGGPQSRRSSCKDAGRGEMYACRHIRGHA